MQDLRRVLDDKDIDAIVIAAPNHWHALATIWALQAGKHVFVEKPASHTVSEGRRMVEAAARYKKIVQVGTMNRSRPAVREAIKFIHDGGIGKVYMARGLCFKPRPPIGKYPDGPMAPGEKYALTVGSTNYEPTYDEQYLSKVDYDLWLGPAPKRPFNRNRFHYNWHWHWDYGNGDTGNQGPHQFDIARWGLNKQEHPVKIQSGGGYFGPESSQETPDTPHHDVRVCRRHDPRVRHARPVHQRRRHAEDRQPVLRHQGLAVDRRRRPPVAVVLGRRTRRGRAWTCPPTADRRRRSARADQHRVAALPELHRRDPRRRCEGAHTAASSTGTCRRRCRTSPTSRIASATSCASTARRRRSSNDKKADKLLTREYRKGWVRDCDLAARCVGGAGPPSPPPPPPRPRRGPAPAP